MELVKYKNLSDSEIVALCVKGDARAWEALIQRYRRLIYSIPARFSFPPSDASDVFQSVCVKLIEHLHDLKDDSKVSSWLITTTTRQCIHLRALKHRHATTDEDFEEPPDPSDGLENLRIQSETEQAVREAVGQLPERCRNLLQMLYFDPRTPSYEEIGSTLNMPVSSIGPTRARCLEKLRIVLRRKGVR